MSGTGSTTSDRLETAGLRIVNTRSSDDRLDLRYGIHWRGAGEPERFVVFLNGRTEWIEKYAYVADDLQLPPGTAFLTWDHRGQGASGGARSYVERYDDFTDDARRIVAEAVGHKPYVLIGHSMGGLIALHATLTGKLSPRALVLASPLLGLPNQPVPRPLSRPLAKLLTLCRFGAVSSGAGTFVNIPFEENILTHSVERYRRMQAGQYKVPGATFGWLTATFAAIDLCFAPARLKELSAPTFVIAGSKEEVVDPDAFGAWVRAAAAVAPVDVQLKIIPGARHELFSEIPAYYDPAIALVRQWAIPRLTDT